MQGLDERLHTLSTPPHTSTHTAYGELLVPVLIEIQSKECNVLNWEMRIPSLTLTYQIKIEKLAQHI